MGIKTSLTIIVYTIVFTGCAQNRSSTNTTDLQKMLTQEQISQDLDSLLEFVTQTHPNLTHTVDMSSLGSKTQLIKEEINDMTSKQAWLLYSQLNPIFNDAHLGIMVPESPQDQYLKRLLVTINNSSIFIQGPEKSTVEILSIGENSIEFLMSRIRKHLRGESRELQNFVLQKRFFSFLKLFDVEFISDEWIIANDGVVESLKFNEIMELYGKNKNISNFDFKLLNEQAAVIEIKTFAKEFYSDFEHFIEKSFEKIESKQIKKLVIDISNNGGGAQELTDLLLSKLTTQKYTSTSKVTARINHSNINKIPNVVLGDTITIPYQKWKNPSSQFVFEGDVFVLISEKTYSQAIVFSNIIQDFKIGEIYGQETGGKTNQTGQVQTIVLPNTNFKVVSPLYIFYRYKNSDLKNGVVPDKNIEINDFYKNIEDILEIE